MEQAPILVLGGVVIFIALYLWLRQRMPAAPSADAVLPDVPFADSGDAVLVARERGRLVFANDTARRWLGVEDGEPDLELVARQAEPPVSLLELFAAETQTSFRLGERWVEGASHRIPAGAETRVVVVLRELTAGNVYPDALDLASAMQVINEIGETVNVGLGIEQVLQALLTIVLKAIPADAGEICLWDEDAQVLTPRGWVGDVAYVLELAEAGGVYRMDEGITGWIARHRQPVLVADRSDPTMLQPKLKDSAYRGFVAAPLMMGDRFIGTFELASLFVGQLGQADLALLQAVSKPLATAIYNAELYTEQVRRLDDIANLQQVAQGQRRNDDVEKIYGVLGEQIARLLTSDMCGVLVYDERKGALVAETPFYGLPSQVVQNYQIPLPHGSPQREIFEDREYWMSNDLADEPLVEPLNLGTLVNAAGMYNTILMPLQIGVERIGVIQVGNKRTHGGFTARDVQNLRILAAQAAVVVQNIRLYQTEQRVDTELTGLQEMTHAIGALSHEGEFYSDLNRRIARLMGISVSGILIYDEASNRLVSQPPFYGADNALLKDYAIALQPGTGFEQIWKEEDSWYSNRVPSDPIIHQAGLADLMAAMGVTKTIFAVLSAGGRRLGLVQASNKLDGEDFTEKDARLLLIFATQAAAMIENARLYREMQRRADEADSVRRVAELAGAINTGGDSFEPVLAEIARLLQSPVVFLSALSAETGSLVTEPRNVYGVELAEALVQDVYARDFDLGVAMSRRPLLANDADGDERFTRSYGALASALELERAVIVPLVVGERRLGELGAGNRAGRYKEDDRRLLVALAIQLASALDRVRLHEATGQNLSRRLHELDAISRVSNELNVTLDFDRVLDVIRREAMQATEASGCTVALLLPRTEWRRNDQPELERRAGDRMATSRLVPIEREAVSQGAQPVLIEDYLGGPLEAMPAGIRSAIAATIVYADEPMGVLHLYHEAPHHFDSQAATFVATLAAKASQGYANAVRYRESMDRSARLRRRVEQLNQIFELGQLMQSQIEIESMLEAFAFAIQQSAGFDVVLIALADHEAGVLRRATHAGLPIEQFEKNRSKTMSLANVERLLNDEFRISESYFLPLDRLTQWYVDGIDLLATAFEGNRSLYPHSKNDWRDGDMLLVPMHGSGGNLIGIISLDRPFSNQRPDRNDIEILEIFAHQASTSIENLRLYEATSRSAEQEARLSEIMQAITHSLDAGEIIEAVARGAGTLVAFSRMTVALAELSGSGFELVSVSAAPDGILTITRDRRATLEGTALGRVIASGEERLYRQAGASEAVYADLRDWQLTGEQTSLILPLLAGGRRLGALHFGSDRRGTAVFEDNRTLLQRIANLAAVAIQNARLFNQAVDLRLFNESVVESIQQGIVVLDRAGRIVSVNAYMRQEFGWDDSAPGRELVEYQPALAALADELAEVLERGEPRERSGLEIATAAGARVQNFYFYPLLAADSTRGAVLLTEDVTEQLRLERDIEERAAQLALLTVASSRITASLNRDEVIELALDEMRGIIPFDSMTLWRRDGDMMTLEGGRGFDLASGAQPTLEIARHERVNRLAQTQQPYTVSRLQGWDALPGEAGAQSWLGVPLIRQNEVVGMIALCKAEPGFYDVQSEQAAFAFANQVAVTLVNSELFTEAQRRTQRLSLLNRVSLSLAQSLDNENILEIALREIAQMLRVERGRAYLLERDIRMARVIVEYPRGDFPPEGMIELAEQPLLQSISSSVQPLIVEDVALAAAENPLLAEVAGRGITAYVAIPVAVSGHAIGIFELEVFDSARHFESEQIDLALIMANQTAIAVQNANLLEQTLVRTRELETLLEAAQATSFTLDLDEVFQNAARLTLQALDMDNCAIFLYTPLDDTLEAQIDLSRVEPPAGRYEAGARLALAAFPARQQALSGRQAVLLSRAGAGAGADAAELAEMDARGIHARMLVPLIAREQSMGLMVIDLHSDGRSVTHRDARMAQALAATAATAIENARLSTETAARVEELLLINDISRSIAATMDVSAMVATLRDYLPALTRAEGLYLALYDAERDEVTFPLSIRHKADDPRAPRPLGNDEVSYVVRTRRLLSLGGDYGLDTMRRTLKIDTSEPDVTAYLGVPLVAGDQVLGVLAVLNTGEQRAFGLNDQRILTTIAAQFSASAQNARLFGQIRRFADELNRRVEERTLELQQERDQLDALYRITSELARTLDIDLVLASALEMVIQTLRADDGVIMLIDAATGALYHRASYLPAPAANSDQPAHPAERLVAWLIEGRRDAIIDDLPAADCWDAGSAGAGEWNSALGVLLKTGEEVQGALVFLSRRSGVFAEPHLRLASAAASQVAVAINNAALYTLIREQAERLGLMLRAEQDEAEKSAAILESIADGVILSDARGQVILYNRAAERILGVPRDAALGQSFRRLARLFSGPESRRLLELAGPDIELQDETIERLELGGRIISARMSPVASGGQLLGTVSVLRDVTRDVEVDRMKSEFIANVSHELRTPMTSIKGYADLLLAGAGGSLQEQQRHFIGTIKGNAERLTGLVNDLLNISRLDAGDERLRLSDVEVNGLVQAAVDSLRADPRFDAKQIAVIVSVEPGLPPLRADEERLMQVLANLLDNAFSYTYSGGQIEVCARLRDDRPHLLVSVRDTGIGIPTEFQARVWGRFERYEEHALVMDVAGTGLGLPIARRLVEMHQGDIWFESEVNKGTTFYVSLPLMPDALTGAGVGMAGSEGEAGQD